MRDVCGKVTISTAPAITNADDAEAKAAKAALQMTVPVCQAIRNRANHVPWPSSFPDSAQVRLVSNSCDGKPALCQAAAAPAPAAAHAKRPKLGEHHNLSFAAGDIGTEALLSTIPAANAPVGPSSFGINESAVIWGTTDFFLQRSGDEANIWFLDQFVTHVCTTTDGRRLGGSDLFPRVCTILNKLTESSITGFRSIWPSLKIAARDDLYFSPYISFSHLAKVSSTVPAPTPNAKKDSDVDPVRGKQDALDMGALLSYIAADLLEGNNAQRALALAINASAIPFSCSATPFATDAFTISGFFDALPGNDLTRFPKEGDSEYDQSILFASAALEVNATTLKSSKKWPLDCIPDDNRTSTVIRAVVHVRHLVSEIDQHLSSVTGKDRKGQLEALADAVDKSLDLVYTIVKISESNVPANVPLLAELDNVIPGVRRLTAEIASGDFGTAVVSGLGVLAGYAGQKLLPDEYPRISAFTSDLVTAEDASAVESAVQRFAAPAGSYRTKRTSGRFYLEVNGYFGGSYGREFVRQDSGEFDYGHGSNTLGFALPIGVEFGHSVCATDVVLCGWSLGVFAQVVDLGALATYRLNNSDPNSVQSAPSVGFKQVLAPGGFLVIGLRKIPLAVMAGYDFVPSLRNVQTAAGTEQRDARRLSVRLAFDIPVFP